MITKSFNTIEHVLFYLEWNGYEPTRKFKNELSRFKKGKEVAKVFLAPKLKKKNFTINFH